MLTLLSEDIELYARAKTEPTSELLNQLEKETYAKMALPQMVTGQLEGRLLKTIALLIGARRCLDIGTFTGYSALSIAEALPADGQVITMDVDEKCLELARKYFAESEHGKKITVKQGPALATIKELQGPFDLVFIDADKENYYNYYQAVLPILRQGGVILVDNVLWSGRVLRPSDDTDRSIAAFNDRIASDERVDRVLLTIRDGLFLIRKR